VATIVGSVGQTEEKFKDTKGVIRSR
jgi:hypothetical protein